MEKIALEASLREVSGKKVKRLRLKGLIPGVVYGHGTDPVNLSVDKVALKKTFDKAGTSALVDLEIKDGKKMKVLFHDPQLHYLTLEPVHFDLYAVKMDEKIETNIPIIFIGVSPAVDELDGNFITNKDELEIRCLPGDLIQNVELDISVLKSFDDTIHVSDVKVPDTIEIVDDLEDIIASVAAPRSEEELEAELAEDKAAEEAAVGALGAEKSDEDEAEGGSTEGDKPVESDDKN